MWRKIIDEYRLYCLDDLFEIKWILYGLSRMLHFSEFVWPLSYSVWDVFNKFPLIDATDRSKISSDQKRFSIALSLYPLSFFANTPFNNHYFMKECSKFSYPWDVWLLHGFRDTGLRNTEVLYSRIYIRSR